jgi:hypothetical protein
MNSGRTLSFVVSPDIVMHFRLEVNKDREGDKLTNSLPRGISRREDPTDSEHTGSTWRIELHCLNGTELWNGLSMFEI